jgi:hypothetical protein
MRTEPRREAMTESLLKVSGKESDGLRSECRRRKKVVGLSAHIVYLLQKFRLSKMSQEYCFRASFMNLLD